MRNDVEAKSITTVGELMKFRAVLSLEHQLRAELIAELIFPALKLIEAAQFVNEILHFFRMRPRADHAQIHLVRIEAAC